MKTKQFPGLMTVLTLTTLTGLALTTKPALAQNVIVSGDSNIVNGLNGSDILTINTGNQRFFRNALGGGTKAVIQDTANGQNVDGVNLDSVLNSYYNGLGGGVSSSQFTGAVTSLSLAGSNLFVTVLPITAYTAPEISALSAFINGGGNVFLLGDGANYALAQDVAINSDLTDLGSSIQLTLDDTDFGAQTVGPADIFTNSLTTGVSSFEFSYTTRLTGGTTLVTDVGGNPFVATQNVASSTATPEPASYAAFGMGGLGLLGLTLKARKRSA